MILATGRDKAAADRHKAATGGLPPAKTKGFFS